MNYTNFEFRGIRAKKKIKKFIFDNIDEMKKEIS